jgi:predicted transcriptional regulator
MKLYDKISEVEFLKEIIKHDNQKIHELEKVIIDLNNEIFKLKENKDNKKERIINLIKENPINISKLSRDTGIKRSSLRYYINELRAENKIDIEKRLNEQGQPSILRLK